ncbi:hypothetical protein L2E82_29493 [Cichorium intybus]|uniref:Uncharacterized protein n=1 Tax=Cichorium intybus TaxID=13427 RepID=A0ACB9CXZ7_CICIN|nr:hypothetical protein L2E82_29493 [Cichorium intybus]
MNERFTSLFNHDGDSMPRVWTGKEDIPAITKIARSSSLKLLYVLAASRPLASSTWEEVIRGFESMCYPRPPELLLGAKKYGPLVDMWSVSCIFAELLHGKPILTGKNEPKQLNKIFEVCGLPKEINWPGVSRIPWINGCSQLPLPLHSVDAVPRLFELS